MAKKSQWTQILGALGACLLALIVPLRPASAARCIFEGDRLKAPVVYIGRVAALKPMPSVERFSLVEVQVRFEAVQVLKSPDGDVPREAEALVWTLSSGRLAPAGPVYHDLLVGDQALVFTDSFLGGYPIELVENGATGLKSWAAERVQWLHAATPEQLAFERIDPAGRDNQIILYCRILEGALGGCGSDAPAGGGPMEPGVEHAGSPVVVRIWPASPDP